MSEQTQLEQTDSAAAEQSACQHPSGRVDWANVLVAIVFGGVFISAIVQALLPDPFWRMAVLGAIVALLAIGLIIYLRRYGTVALVTNYVILGLASVLPLTPIVLQSSDDRMLVYKIGSVFFLSAVPGWLYLQFISTKGQSLQDEYILNLYRLRADDMRSLPEPPAASPYYGAWHSAHADDVTGTASDAPVNLYIRKFQAVYGHAQGAASRENLAPVLFTTILLSAGWVGTLQPELLIALPAPFAGTAEAPVLPFGALSFGFMGSYFFILQVMVRRYFQDDLKTTAYISACVRIIAVALLVIAIHAAGILPAGQEQLLAFLIGVFPQVGLQAIEALVTVPLRNILPNLRTEFPLSDLDGLNIWYESRLLEEGIEDMQNLATANIVDAMLRTRVPVDRLVDWVDQAHLYMHVRKDDAMRSANGQPGLSSREVLRHLGIRTATDLQDVCALRTMDTPGSPESTRHAELATRVRAVLNDPGSDAPNAVDAILAAIGNEPNLYHVRSWKDYRTTTTKS